VVVLGASAGLLAAGLGAGWAAQVNAEAGTTCERCFAGGSSAQRAEEGHERALLYANVANVSLLLGVIAGCVGTS